MHVPTIEPFMLIAGALVALAIVATRLSVRLGMPALILFLGTGMLAGSEGVGGIWFNDPALTWSAGVATLAILLFAGGLETNADHIRPILAPGLVLATVGVLTSAAATAAFYTLAFDRPLAEGVLLGAIVSSTDAAAVFGVLRSAGIRLRGRIQPLLEMESGANDPIAIFLTLAASAWLVGSAPSPWAIAGGAALQMALGLGAGFLGGKGIVWAVNRLDVAQEGLYPVFTAALALVLFGATSLLHGSGFLAVYVAGILVGSAPLIHHRPIVRFHDALAWLAQILMFVLLGLLVFPSHLPGIAGQGISIVAFLCLVARPLAVVVSLTPFGVPFREQAMIAWVGLRGAVPIVLAAWPRVMGVSGSETVFDIVFFVVVASVLLQGMTLPLVARLLGVIAPEEPGPVEIPGEARGATTIDVVVGAVAHARSLVELGLPPGTLVVFVQRDGELIVPQGGTVLRRGDVARVLVKEGQARPVRELLR